ncbi:unnamed protein product [Lasius platythorax]|uniref:Secreted protein n=1 Tax=Lasius platythorax TaxID=488582 RepID=A0AAV2P8G4_9HYME
MHVFWLLAPLVSSVRSPPCVRSGRPDLPFTPLGSLHPQVPAATSMPTRQSRRPSTSHRIYTSCTPTTSDWGTAVSGLAGEGTSPTRSDIPHLPHPIRRSSLWSDITYILLLHPTTLRQHPHYKQLRVPWFVRRRTDRQASGITPLVAAG